MIKSADLFNQYASDVTEAKDAPLVMAYKVKQGDSVTVPSFLGMPAFVTAEEDCWQVRMGRDYFVVTDDELSAEYVREDVLPTRSLPEGATAEPVAKGETVITQPWSNTTAGVESEAEYDGWLVSLPENDMKTRLMSDAEFHAKFISDAAPLNPEQEQAFYREIPTDETALVPYLVLPTDVTLDFEEGAYEAKAGDVLYKNDDDVDGYTVVSREFFDERFIAADKAQAEPQLTSTRKPGGKGPKLG